MTLDEAIRFFQNSIVDNSIELRNAKFASPESHLRMRLISVSIDILDELEETSVGNSPISYANEKISEYRRTLSELISILDK